MVDAVFQEGLAASVGIYDMTKDAIESAAGADVTTLPTKDLQRIKKLAARTNRSITRLYDESKEREARTPRATRHAKWHTHAPRAAHTRRAPLTGPIMD